MAIKDFLRVSSKNLEKIKAWTFDEDQILEFMTQAPYENRHFLVRKAIVAINVYGGLCGEELRGLIRSKVRSVKKGYEIEYLVSKQTELKKWNT